MIGNKLQPQTPSSVRHSNYRSILSVIASKDSCSALDISEAVGLSKTAISKALLRLQDWGFILHVGKGSTSSVGGKRPDLYAMNPDFRYSCCISFQQNATIVALHDFVGQPVIQQSNTDTIDLSSRTAFIHHCRNCVIDVLMRKKITVDQLSGIMLISDYDHFSGRHKIIEALFPTKAEQQILIDELANSLHASTSIYIENSRHLRGYAELRFHPECKNENIAVISVLRNNITGCIIENGSIVYGANGTAGEFGHIVTDYSLSRQCACGNRGCAVSVCLKDGIHDYIRRRLDEGVSSSLAPLFNREEEPEITEVFEAISQGDPLALEFNQFQHDNYARMLFTIQLTLNPDHIFLQTGPFNRSRIHEGVYHTFLKKNQALGLTPPKFTISDLLPMDAAFWGAADYCIHRYIQDPDHFDLNSSN